MRCLRDALLSGTLFIGKMFNFNFYILMTLWGILGPGYCRSGVY